MITLQTHLTPYLHHCQYQKELDVKTIKAYRIDLTQFFSFLSSEKLEIDRQGINKYLFCIHSQFKQRTVKRKIASLKAFINYLEYEEIIEVNPFHKINTKFKEEIILPRTIPRHIVQLLLQSLYAEKQRKLTQNEYKYLLRDIAIIEVLFATGLRVSELCALKTKEIDMENGTFRVKGKGSKERYMQIGNDEVMDAMMKYYEFFEKDILRGDYFFLNKNKEKISEQAVRIIIKKHAEQANVSMHLTPHMFRHAFATLLLEEDVDIRYIQKMLGHSSIATTQIYTYVTSEKQKEILQMKHPRNKMHCQ